MDDMVKAALLKWPRVPHCYGWLALDARGDWYMRDDRIQAAGPFPAIKGSRILHDKLREFIHRNYQPDEHGAWYFQNGPQRVYVQLEAAPYVWRLQALDPGWEVVSHTGLATEVSSVWLCEQGRLFLHTPLGLGLVHSLDMGIAAQAVEAGDWQPQDLPWAQMPQRFGFQLAPQPGG
jgi:Protein of unknown function (DUF2946)